MLGSTHM